MEIVAILLVVIAVGATLAYFLTSSTGMHLVRKKTVSTILNNVRALQHSAPETPFYDIYYALAEEQTDKSK